MTHSLHRVGNTSNLKEDFVILVTPSKDINHKGSKEKLNKILDKIFELKPNNIGSYETGTIYSGATIEQIKERFSEVPRVRCSFDSKEKVVELLTFMRHHDFGLSVTLSGLIDETLDICNFLNIKPHSAHLSLGVYGNKEQLPSNQVLEFLTMCGHGMISKDLVIESIEKVKNGTLTPKNAAERLAKPCICGIFNTHRAQKLFETIANEV